MAYGTEAGVTLLIGGTDVVTFTSANIAAAIAMADVLVDKINDNASATIKTLASNIISADIMKKGRVNKLLKGLSSDAGNQGRPARSGSTIQDYIPKSAWLLLEESYPASTFTTKTPDSSGAW